MEWLGQMLVNEADQWTEAGRESDGGHRAPLFLHWPGDQLHGGRRIDELCLDIDLLPTCIELCDLPHPAEVTFDGRSLAPLLRGSSSRFADDRVHFLHNQQGTETPPKWHGAALTRRWRLIHGRELYDITADPGQRIDVSESNPAVVTRLREAYSTWHDTVAEQMARYCPIVLGHPAENPTRLDAMDVLGDVIWQQARIAEAQRTTGRWAVEVVTPGRYRFSLRRWPAELDLPMDAGISPDAATTLAHPVNMAHSGRLAPRRARVQLFGVDHVIEVEAGTKEATVAIDVSETGETRLEAWFIDAEGNETGAYYVFAERL